VVAALGAVAAVTLWPDAPSEAPPKQVPPANVRVMRIAPIARLPDAVTLPGSVEPNNVVRVAAEVPGRIETVLCREGRPVRAGEVLLKLNTDLLQAEYDQAKATSEFDAREVLRVADLVRSGVATNTELDQARTRAAASRAAFDAARARLDRSTVRLPLSGVLNRLPVKAGEYVQPGQMVAEVVQIDTVKVLIDVPEQDILYLRTGQPATVYVDARGGKAVGGTLTYIGELADPKSRTTPAEVTAPNADGALKSGQLVSVELVRRVQQDVILIPLAAVISLENGKRVYLVDSGRAQPRDVTLAGFRTMAGTIYVEVLSGLRAGDVLIVDNPRLVGPGQEVNVVGGNGPATRAGGQTSQTGQTGPTTEPAPAAPGGRP